MKRKVDIITLIIVGALFASAVLFNAFQTDRPTVSVSEQRTLNKFPEFSVDSLTDGSYFAGISSFVSDTFIGREGLIGIANKVRTLYGTNDSELSFISVENAETSDITLDIPDAAERIDDTGESETLEAEVQEFVFGDETDTEITETEKTVEDSGSEAESTAAESAEAQPDETDPPETESPVKELTLSSYDIYLSVGQGKELYAYVTPEGLEGVRIAWRNENANIAKLTAEGDHLLVTGVAAGTTKLTAGVGKLQAVCNVHVSVSIKPDENVSEIDTIITNEPEILTNGLVIYKDAVYSIPYFVKNNAQYFADTVKYYASLFPKSRVSVVVGPLASATLPLDTFGRGRLTDQNDIIRKVFALMDKDIVCVNPFDKVWQHRDEYLYFKSDHHWTGRGAYYAYASFAEAVGMTPTPLESFTEMKLTDKFQGTMYSFTKDERVKLIYDSVYAYIPTKAHTMTIYNSAETTYNSSILTQYGSYGAFIGGDNGYTVITVPDNPQNKNCMVLKDSFGNAFVPYLCEHYGHIIVVDPRHVTFNIYELLKDYPLDDIIFASNIYNPNVAAWSRYLLNAVGVKTN